MVLQNTAWCHARKCGQESQKETSPIVTWKVILILIVDVNFIIVPYERKNQLIRKTRKMLCVCLSPLTNSFLEFKNTVKGGGYSTSQYSYSY